MSADFHRTPIGKSLTSDVTPPPVVDRSGYTDECNLFDALYAAFQQHAPTTLTPHPRYL